jgi:hypothetical protein
MYRITGRRAWFPDEYLSQLGMEPKDQQSDVPIILADHLFDYQRAGSELSIRKRKFAQFWRPGLGKTLAMLEHVRHARRVLPARKRCLITSPLMVIDQSLEEAAKFYPNLHIDRVRTRDLAGWLRGEGGIGITNYEAMADDLEQGNLGCLDLDESSLLKSHYGKWGQVILRLGRGLEWKLCLTGTPAPNDRIEYANHAVFLDQHPTVNSFLARYFVNRGQTNERWELKPHALEAFYRSLSHWALFINDPATYGWVGNSLYLPPIRVHIEHYDMTSSQREAYRKLTGHLVVSRPGGIGSRAKLSQLAKGTLNGQDVPTNKFSVVRKLVDFWPSESTIIWCRYNAEQDRMTHEIPHAASISGSTPLEKRREIIRDFKEGRIRTLISKPKIMQFGLNLQIVTRHVWSTLVDCYSDDTEILTSSGWRLIASLTRGDEVATVNPLTNRFEWQTCSRVVNENYDGDMIRFSGGGYDLLVTPNHRIWCLRDPRRYATSNGIWKAEYAKDVADSYKTQCVRMMRTPCGWLGRSPGFVPIRHVVRKVSSMRISPIDINDYASLVGWYLSEGYTTRHKGKLTGRIVICQTEYNIEYRREIIALLKRIGFKPRTVTKDITFSCKGLAVHLSERFGEGSYHKRIPSDIRAWKSEHLTLLFDAMLKGDGHKCGGTHDSLKSVSSGLLDDAQEIALKLGIATSVNDKHSMLNIAWKSRTPSLLKQPSTERYVGRVVCCDVPNGLLIVRRKGKPIVSGNSYEEFWQGCCRSNRVGSTKPLDVHIPVNDLELPMVDTVLSKVDRVQKDMEEQESTFRRCGRMSWDK